MWLVASSELTDLAVVRDGKPALWRELRRFNAPIQLAVAAAHDVVARAIAPADAAVISLAPCQSGAPEVHKWIRDTAAGGTARVNPIYTLHCVDNLALSVLALAIANHAWAMSLGGTAGMMWSALELALERDEHEVIVMAGDQLNPFEPSPAAGVAMLLSRERTPHVVTGRPTRLAGIERQKMVRPISPDIGRTIFDVERQKMVRPISVLEPHAAAGAMAMLAALRGAPVGNLSYVVPVVDGDGIDEVVVRWEVSA